MSCVVGLKSDKGIIMGADSAALMGNYIMSSYKEKIFIKDNFVYGACGLVRQSQVLRCYFSEPPIAVGQDIESYLVGPYSVALGDCLRECGLLEKPLQADPGEASKYTGVEFAIALGGQLFTITQDLAVIPIDDYIALGSGGEYAMGAMHALEDVEIYPKHRLLRALQASASHSPDVKAPFYIVTISEDGSTTEE